MYHLSVVLEKEKEKKKQKNIKTQNEIKPDGYSSPGFHIVKTKFMIFAPFGVLTLSRGGKEKEKKNREFSNHRKNGE